MNSISANKKNQVAIFSDKNANKSNLFYKLTQSNISISKDKNPMKKGIEFISDSPVIFIDTANLIQNTSLNNESIINTLNFLDEIDLVLYLIDKNDTQHSLLNILKDELEQKNTPYIVIFIEDETSNCKKLNNYTYVSLSDQSSIDNLINKIAQKLSKIKTEPENILSNIFKKENNIIIVSENNSCTNCGYSSLDKQIIDSCIASNINYKLTSCDNLLNIINQMDKVDLVITDDNNFEKINNMLPKNIYSTSKSILSSVAKDTIDTFLNGIKILDTIENGDYILIAEICSQSYSKQNIGRIKIPFMIRNKTLKDINFVFASGDDYPDDLSKFKLVVHCGNCFKANTQMYNILNKFNNITSYGLVTAYCSNTLDKSLDFFKKAKYND